MDAPILSTTVALATRVELFTPGEEPDLAGFLAGYSGLTREAYAPDLRQYVTWCTAREASVILARRSEIEADIADLDHQLASDLRIRSRFARREQPEPVVAVLGPRPEPGHDARRWDTAAGRLAQHLAAFDLHSGLEVPGPNAPLVRRLDYEVVSDLSGPLVRPVNRTIPVPDLGLSR